VSPQHSLSQQRDPCKQQPWVVAGSQQTSMQHWLPVGQHVTSPQQTGVSGGQQTFPSLPQQTFPSGQHVSPQQTGLSGWQQLLPQQLVPGSQQLFWQQCSSAVQQASSQQ
jgi:hypothetical protein